MLCKGAHHISLTVDDVDAALGFYRDLLGLSEIERPDFGFPGAWLQAGSVELHILGRPPTVDVGSPPPNATPIANHIAFEIEDYEGVKSRLEESGCEVMALGANVGQMFTRDPHGNMIEFIQPGGDVGGVQARARS